MSFLGTAAEALGSPVSVVLFAYGSLTKFAKSIQIKGIVKFT